MPDCSKCFAFIPPDAKSCPKCGAAASNGDFLDPELAKIDDKVHALLISSNLMKLRGDLDGAIQECIKAMRVDPDSVEAHSLLGDIYRDQGNIEEASRWYQLALDLNPNSSIDKRRLEQLSYLDKQKVSSKQSGIPAASAAMINWVTVGILSAIILVLITAIIWPLLPNMSNQESESVEAPSISNLAHRPRRVQNSTDHNVNQVISSTLESGIVKDLNAASSLTGNSLKVISLSLDPRLNAGTITFVGPAIAENERIPVLVKYSLLIAREAFQRDTALTKITARALYSIPVNGESRSEVVFIADTSRDAAMKADPDTTDYSQQGAALENVWYHQAIVPVTAP